MKVLCIDGIKISTHVNFYKVHYIVIKSMWVYENLLSIIISYLYMIYQILAAFYSQLSPNNVEQSCLIIISCYFQKMDRNIDEKDEDMFTDYKNAFPSSYNFVTSKNLTDDENSYVLHLSLNSNSSVIASGLNTSKITVCDTTTLSELASFEAHEGDLSGMKFSPENTNYIYTSSSQECIKLWDIRDYKTPARTFIDTSVPVQNGSANKDIPKKPLISFDVNRSDEFIAAGTEQVVKDAFLLFWDVGSGKMLGGYWESYGDDVTTVSFHPEDNDRLATGGTDGLINIFDISQSTEDDALITSINTESSIRDVHWYKVRNKITKL